MQYGAVQFKVQCRMADPGRMRVPAKFGISLHPLLDRARGLLRGGYEFLEGLAGSIEAGLGHRSQFLRQETAPPERARWFSRIKVIAALDTFAAARPWTCRSPRAILTVR